MYDVMQGTMLGSVKPWRPIKTAKGIKRGFSDVLAKSDDYYKAAQHGLFSKPFNNPYMNHVEMIADAQNTFHGRYLGILDDALRLSQKKKLLKSVGILNPIKDLKEIYNTSWNLAWLGDESIRMNSWHMMKEKLTKDFMKSNKRNPTETETYAIEREAAQISAEFHADYASVPAKTRRFLNKIFFTPTFKVVMGSLHKDMVMGATKYVAKRGKVTGRDKTMARGLVATLGILEGTDLFMTQVMGFERDQWARRYYRDVEIEDENGNPITKEVVVTFSNPANMFVKYGQRIAGAFLEDRENPWKDLFMQHKWEIHPIWRTLFEIGSYTNESARMADRTGRDVIWHPKDSMPMKRLKEMEYGITRIIPILKTIDEPHQTTETKKALDREIGLALRLLIQPFTFSYIRGTESDRKAWKVFREKDLYKQIIKMRTTTEKHKKRAMKDLLESIKAYKKTQ